MRLFLRCVIVWRHFLAVFPVAIPALRYRVLSPAGPPAGAGSVFGGRPGPAHARCAAPGHSGYGDDHGKENRA
jgi:hypothetical protein